MHERLMVESSDRSDDLEYNACSPDVVVYLLQYHADEFTVNYHFITLLICYLRTSSSMMISCREAPTTLRPPHPPPPQLYAPREAFELIAIAERTITPQSAVPPSSESDPANSISVSAVPQASVSDPANSVSPIVVRFSRSAHRCDEEGEDHEDEEERLHRCSVVL